MSKTNRSVVRNQAYQKKEFSIRERHNERKNETYYNSDIQPDREHLNVYFKRCDGSYNDAFEKMLADGTISTRGLKPDAKVFDEMVFDVNTEYFEKNGGYEYAKRFFEEAYRCAVKEIGGEQYVLSAVMHADERNKALSEKLGRYVYHHHLHVAYIPVVDKEILYTKRCKDLSLVGTVREVIQQVSHSKKWPRFKSEKGWVNSYSLLQDKFHEHMKEAGFTGFERGERGSSAEHLSVLEYKTLKEAERAAAIAATVEKKQEAAAMLDERAAKTKKQLDEMKKKAAIVKEEYITFVEIDNMGVKKILRGDVALSPADWTAVSRLAKEGVKSRAFIAELKNKVESYINKTAGLEKRLAKYESMSITDDMKYYQAKQRAPRRMAEIVADIMRKPPERQETTRAVQDLRRSQSLEI